MLSLDVKMDTELEALSPYKSAFDLKKPFSVSNNLSLSKTVASMMANWLHYDLNQQFSEQQMFFTKSLFRDEKEYL